MSSLKCTIPGVSLKVFGRAIQSLSKIGDELYFEPLDDGLYLRSVNSSRSAYACFQFSPSFFLHYVNGSQTDANNSDDDFLRCKIGMKSVMTVFKSLSTIDKTVEKCRISLNLSEARLVFQMYCRHGIIKTHNLAYIECETLQAVYSKDLCPNKFTAPPKLLCDAVLAFQTNQEEITLIMRPDYVALKNYVDDEPDPNKVIHTELTLSPNEFDNYQVGVDSDVTFCLKELRAILGFADITSLPLTVQFEGAGKPITFSITSDLSFEANFVLATLADVESSQISQSKTKHGNTSRKTNTSHSTKQPNGGLSVKSTKELVHKQNAYKNLPEPSNAIDDDGDDAELTMAMMDITAPDETLLNNEYQQYKLNQGAKNISAGKSLNNQDENSKDCSIGENGGKDSENKNVNRFASSDDTNSEQIANRLNNQEQSFHTSNYVPDQTSSPALNNRKTLSLKSAYNSDTDVSPVIPIQSDTNNKVDDPLEEDSDEIPATPPSKKFRSVFFGTQSSTQSSQSQRKRIILAPNSDEED
ncbi:cell cycle checkpoint control protein RAD9A-like isoform X2 [Physella acuta]|uniref:cell cycle checkpoint control protein RAD9A-like isoform X2 n=1 Tax=Physella acuta TaxID=109671 RepID=UPI0027DBA43D|nr:cell cycle checkpoint control protein RAD9A-like isoform X2 [Physella acuta]